MTDAYRHCEELVRTFDKDRYLATLFAPAERRGALFALYAFAAEIATVRDRAREPMPGEIRLQWWRDVLNGERGGEAASHPVAAALTDTVARFNLPAEPLLDLIEAHSFDLYDDPMPTRAALEAYVRKTTSVLFALGAQIAVGVQHDAVSEAADHAGIAYALTGLLRSIALHASRRQIYVPLDLIERYRARTEDILAGNATPGTRAALAELREEAQRNHSRFEACLPALPSAAMAAFLPAALAPGYLSLMQRSDYDPFKTAIEVPQWRRQWVLWRAARRYARAMRG